MNMGKMLFGQCGSFNKDAVLAKVCKLRYFKWAINIKLYASINIELDLSKLKTKRSCVNIFFWNLFSFHEKKQNVMTDRDKNSY